MISDRIRTVRKKAGLTQQQFANRIGTCRANIGGYESETRLPSQIIVYRICECFDVNQEWLLHGTGPAYRSKNPEAAFREFISRYFRCTNPFCGALLVVLSGLSEEQWSLLESVCRAICRSVLRSSTPPASKAVYSQVSLDREAGNRAAESGPRPGNRTAGKAPASKSRTAGAASRPGNHAAGTASGTKSRSSAPAPKK